MPRKKSAKRRNPPPLAGKSEDASQLVDPLQLRQRKPHVAAPDQSVPIGRPLSPSNYARLKSKPRFSNRDEADAKKLGQLKNKTSRTSEASNAAEEIEEAQREASESEE